MWTNNGFDDDKMREFYEKKISPCRCLEQRLISFDVADIVAYCWAGQNFLVELISEKAVLTPAGVCSAPLHIQQPVVGVVDYGRKLRSLQSGLMKLSMVSSAVTEEKWAAALL